MNEQHYDSEAFHEEVYTPNQNKSNGVAATDINMEIAALAALSPLDYQLARKDAAKRLGIQVGFLDDRVRQSRPPEEGEKGQGTAVTFEEVLPWTDPVDGEFLLQELTATLKKHVVLTEEQGIAVALWITHAHALAGC